MRSLDGESFAATVASRAIPWGDQRGVVAVVHDAAADDVRDRTHARDPTQARYSAAFEEAMDAMVVADDDGRYVDANESACELFGVTREALLGSHVADFAPDDYDFDAAWAEFEADATDVGSFPLVRPDGERRLVEYAATADIVPGEHLSVLRDVTERTRLEEALQTEQNALREMYRITADRDADFEAKLRDLLDLGRDLLDVPYGFVTEIDDDTQLVVQSRGDHPMLQPGESCPLSEAYCRRTITSDELATVQNAAAEGWSDDPAFERFGLGCYAGAEIVVDGETYGTFCFADTDPREEPFSETERTFVELLSRWASYEIEQRRATERLRRQNERLEEFASMVSHDLRSPLNVARGFLDLAREDGDPEHFDRASDALDRMERIISDVLYLAREGEEIGETEPVDLAEAAAASWDVVDAEAADLTLADASAASSRTATASANCWRTSSGTRWTTPARESPSASSRPRTGSRSRTTAPASPGTATRTSSSAATPPKTTGRASGSTSSAKSRTPTAGRSRRPPATTAARASSSPGSNAAPERHSRAPAVQRAASVGRRFVSPDLQKRVSEHR
nr:PAS domain S-box protein [Halobacterium sp. CBA1126]